MPVTQVNNYWNGIAAGYGNTPANAIGAGDTWTVSLIWSDLAGLYSATTSTAAATLTKATGTGTADYFELMVPAGLPDGNFLVGLKKTGGSDYLWSWHLWITDYAPDKFNNSDIASGTYTYSVPGGQVERYNDNGAALWNGGIYSNSVMMDRNLGAVENFFTAQPTTASRGYLLYQFGRKDPFPNVLSSDPNAQVSALTLASGPATIATSVANPWVFYTMSGGNWTGDASDGTCLWSDPNCSTAVNTGKSIYDPCPPGWKMPVAGTWNGFSAAYATLGGSIWYPAAGGRLNISSGALSGVGGTGYYWSATPYADVSTGYALYFSGTYIPLGYATNRCNGFSVRCVSQ